MYVTAFFMYSPTLRLNALGLARVVAFPSAKMMKFGHISSRPRHSPFRTTVQEKIKNTSNSKDIEDNHDANDRSEVQHQIDLIILIYCVYNIYIYIIFTWLYTYIHISINFFPNNGIPLMEEYLESGSPLAGWGVGLALGRLYARCPFGWRWLPGETCRFPYTQKEIIRKW